MEDALVKNRTVLAPENLNQLQFIYGTNDYTYLKKTAGTQEWIRGNEKGEMAYLTLAQLNAGLQKSGYHTVDLMPAIQFNKSADALLTINNEKIRCFPSYKICNDNFESIDSIKILFEKKSSSKWLKITQEKYSQIIPIVQVDFMISNYEFFENKKYLITKSALEYIK